MTVELIQGLLLAFAIVVILMPPYIRLLRATGFTKQIRIEGPDSHQVKHGTPTMGGALIISVVVALYLLLRWPPEGGIFAPLAALAGVGLLGAFDDYLNAKTGEGIRVRQKLVWQIVVAFVAAWQIQRTYGIDQIAVPFLGPVAIAPWVFVLFAAFAIIAASNGVNITDGLDGLAAGTAIISLFTFTTMAVIAYIRSNSQHPELRSASKLDLAIVGAALIGAAVGFLWYNAFPAEVFMGDTGSMALGGAIAGLAVMTKTEELLIVLGGIFVVEALSVLIQVFSFQTFRKRVFLMAPVHHHFEILAWSETKIILRFWIVAAICSAIGFTLYQQSIV